MKTTKEIYKEVMGHDVIENIKGSFSWDDIEAMMLKFSDNGSNNIDCILKSHSETIVMWAQRCEKIRDENRILLSKNDEMTQTVEYLYADKSASDSTFRKYARLLGISTQDSISKAIEELVMNKKFCQCGIKIKK